MRIFWPFKKRTTWKDHFDRGMAAGGAGDIEVALGHFRDAVRLAPTEPYPHYELGYTLSLLGKFEPALQELRRTNELIQGFFQIQTEIYMCEAVLAGLLDHECMVTLRQIQSLGDSGQAQSQKAASLSRDVIARAPTSPLGHYYLGKALFAMDPKASEAALRHCVGLSPDDAIMIDALAHIGSHIQRLIITRVPVLIGAGIPLFGPLQRDISLKHVATRQYASGLVQSEYLIAV